MKQKQTFFMALSAILAMVLGCNTTEEPEWTKAKMIAGGQESASALIADDKFLYYVTGGHLAALREGKSGVFKIPIVAGGRPTELFKGYQEDKKNVVLPDTFVLAIDEKSIYFAAGHIYRIPKEGGEAQQITAGKPTEMVADEENIYWHDFVGEGMQDVPVFSVNKNGGERKVVVESAKILDIAVDKDFFYWAQPDGIYKQPKKGGEKTLVIRPKNGGRINGMIADQNSLYFLDNDALFMIPKIGDALVQITSGVNTVHKFFADEKNIYFVKNEGSFGTSLNKVSKNGGEVIKLDSGYIGSFTVGKDKIYVSDKSKIYELEK